ncbi:MAG: NAD-dependent protein deacylase [Elusimicrobia bacterium]|nr:NAD-dependent protein deacylase [Elusimicrobiota bacterium]
MKSDLEQVKKIVAESDNIVFFGGAGMSTESGIPDFRSADGIYNQEYKYPPEQVIGRSFFLKHPDVFYDFYREKILKPGMAAKPNPAHLKLAELEKKGKLKAVITQNIDHLHQKAGSKNVLQLHGTINENYCMKCDKDFDLDYVANTEGAALCDDCGGLIHPGIVLFEEPLDNSITRQSLQYIEEADVVIVGGTSLAVYPAAGFIDYYQGDKLILVNLSRVANPKVNYFIQGKVGEIISQWD